MAVIKTKYLTVGQQSGAEFSDQYGQSPTILLPAQGSMCPTEKVKQIESAQLLANSLSCKAACLLGTLVPELDSSSHCLPRRAMGCTAVSSEQYHVRCAGLKTFLTSERFFPATAGEFLHASF